MAFGLMGKRRTKMTGTSMLPSATPGTDESVLESSLTRIEQFVEALDIRAQQAIERANDAAQGTRAAARAVLRAEEALADLEAGRRLRDQISAAVLVATAQVAVVETAAAAAVRAAFKQFVTARGWRRGAVAAKTSSGARPRRSSARAKSMEELGEMAAKAKDAAARVIADRERLARWLAEVHVQTDELRRSATAAAGERDLALGRAVVCEGQAAYLYQQLLAQTAIADQLELELQKLFQKLPEPARAAAAMHRPHEEPDDNRN